ncbi:MAG: hypothetical protein U9Q06_03280 [Nanoarchaeota archaeon]|nr:hypothetical protein [Nanoarchaeota archaeon]
MPELRYKIAEKNGSEGAYYYWFIESEKPLVLEEGHLKIRKSFSSRPCKELEAIWKIRI